MTYRIMPCRLAHIARIARTMRDQDRAEIEMAGLPVKHFCCALYRASDYRRVAVIDDDVIAVWGDQAPLLSSEGQMWLLTSPAIEKLPLAFFREARREIRERLEVRSVLRADTSATYRQAIRFFALLGFEVLPRGSDGSAARREIRLARAG